MSNPRFGGSSNPENKPQLPQPKEFNPFEQGFKSQKKPQESTQKPPNNILKAILSNVRFGGSSGNDS